jgi:hypothetical protein
VHGAGALQLERLVKTDACVAAAFTFRVAGISARVACEEPGVSIAVSGAGRAFLSDDEGADVTIAVSRGNDLREPDGPVAFDSGGVWRLYRSPGALTFSFRSSAHGDAPYRLATFDDRFRTGRVVLDRAILSDPSVVEPLEYPLDELLLMHLLARGRGVEVHACGVVDAGGSAWLFAGHSEAGKSTTANLWHAEQATILSDDRMILTVEGDRVVMHGTPWHGDAGFAMPSSAPVRRIFFLEHGAANRLTQLSGAAAAARLLARAFLPFHDPAGLGWTMELLERIVERVPCAEFAFVPDPTAVDLVRGLA